MNKKLLGIVLVILLLIGSGTAFLLMQKDENPEKSGRPTSDETPAVREESQQSPAIPEKAGQYIDYNEQSLPTAEGRKLLFFYAPWCPQCRALEADILDKGVPNGVTIFKVDYDTNQGLRQKYGVTIQTTVVEVDENSNLVDKFVAYDEPTLASVKENLLQ